MTVALVRCLSAGEATASRTEKKRGSIMRRFEEIIEANPDRGPHRYLVLRRMHLTRRRLALSSADTTTVTQIAMDYGFYELGRFAVYYRRLFGESPSTTLRRPPREEILVTPRRPTDLE